jgi:two-component system, LuxR family, sensor kinase FixL
MNGSVSLTSHPDEASPTMRGSGRDSDLHWYHCAVERSPDAILSCNRRGLVTDLNPAAESLFGYARGDALGLRFAALLAPDSLDDGLRAIACSHPLGGGDDVPIELIGLRADQSHFPMQLIVARTMQRGSFVATVIVRDLSQLRAAEDAAQRHFEALAHATRLASMAEIATGLAHEVSQPITAMLNYAAAAQRLLPEDAAASADLAAALKQIRRQGLRAAELLRRLRDYIHPNDRQARSSFLNASVHDVLDLLRAEIAQSEARVELLLQPDLPAMSLDRVAIEQVVFNLVRNALDAMMEVPADARGLRIGTCVDLECGVAVVSIEDGGPGLPPGDPEQLFAPYFTTKAKGLGLGLSICRGIVESHGGRLWAESADGGGACFQFTLPLDRQA